MYGPMGLIGPLSSHKEAHDSLYNNPRTQPLATTTNSISASLL